MLFAMGCSSIGFGLLLSALTTPGVPQILWGGVVFYLGVKTWRAVLKVAYQVHLETGVQLQDELTALQRYKERRTRSWPFGRKPDS